MYRRPRRVRLSHALHHAGFRVLPPLAVITGSVALISYKYAPNANALRTLALFLTPTIAGWFLGDLIHYYRHGVEVENARRKRAGGILVYSGMQMDESRIINKGLWRGIKIGAAVGVVLGGINTVATIIRDHQAPAPARHGFEQPVPATPLPMRVQNGPHARANSNG